MNLNKLMWTWFVLVAIVVGFCWIASAAECTTYTLDGHAVLDCGDEVTVRGSSPDLGSYYSRHHWARYSVEKEIDYLRSLAIERAKHLVALELQQAGRTTVSVNSGVSDTAFLLTGGYGSVSTTANATASGNVQNNG